MAPILTSTWELAEHVMKPWLRPRAFLEHFLRGVTFLASEDLDEILANKANQQCHFKTYRALDVNVSTGIVMGTVPMTIPVDKLTSSAL